MHTRKLPPARECDVPQHAGRNVHARSGVSLPKKISGTTRSLGVVDINIEVKQISSDTSSL